MHNTHLKKLVYCGVTTALVIVATAYLKIPTPIGYIHLGDGIILVSGALLGPLAFIPAAVGSAFADLIAGFPYYAIATFVIKGLMGLISGLAIKKKAFSVKNLIVFILVELIMVAGYFVFEVFLYNFSSALAAVMFNLIQAAAGVVMGLLFIPATKKIRL